MRDSRKKDQDTFRDKQRPCKNFKPLFKYIELSQENTKNNFLVKNELLNKKKVDKITKEKLLIFVPDELRKNKKKKKNCHKGTFFNLGVIKTKHKISRYFLQGFFKEIVGFVKTCDKYRKAGKIGEKVKAHLKLVPVTSSEFEKNLC